VGDLGDACRSLAAPDVVDIVTNVAEEQVDKEHGQIGCVAVTAAVAPMVGQVKDPIVVCLSDQVGDSEARFEVLVRTYQ
jgi:hypothetical protein